MKTLIFSDSHLTDKFDQELFDYISNLVKGVDQVILNGDFWDGYLTTFDSFVNSEWSKLFPLLKEKKAIFIFGNHDEMRFMDERVSLFSDKQLDFYEFESGGKNIYVAHGHLVAPTYDVLPFLGFPIYMRTIYSSLVFLRNKFSLFNSFLLLFETKKTMRQIRQLTTFVSKNYQKNKIYIFGHIHVPIVKKSKNLIIMGKFKDEKRSCIIENGKIQLHP